MSRHLKDWSWKEEEPKPYEKRRKKEKPTKAALRKRRKQRKKRLAFDSLPNDFYSSKEWRKLRYQVLRKYSAECMCCGRSKKYHGVVVHVDHIKPRSKFPSLALEFKNMQILCEDCNMGKSNIDSTDWRPNDIDEEAELAIVAAANERF